jgi:hypothetical protein
MRSLCPKFSDSGKPTLNCSSSSNGYWTILGESMTKQRNSSKSGTDSSTFLTTKSICMRNRSASLTSTHRYSKRRNKRPKIRNQNAHILKNPRKGRQRRPQIRKGEREANPSVCVLNEQRMLKISKKRTGSNGQ